MPQFDFYTFFVQIIWLVAAAVLFYLIYLKGPINRKAFALKLRERVREDLAKKIAAIKSQPRMKSTALYDVIVLAWLKRFKKK